MTLAEMCGKVLDVLKRAGVNGSTTTVQRQPKPLALVVRVSEKLTALEAGRLRQSLADALGEDAPPIIIAPAGVDLKTITDPDDLPDWWAKK